MDGREVIENLRAAVRDAEAAGHKAIDPAALKSFLDSLEREASGRPSQQMVAEANLEEYRARLSKWIADNAHFNEWSLESFRQIIALGQSAIKSIFFINGGAAVALLAFIGHLATSATTAKAVMPFAHSLQLFVFGVFCAALTSALTYLCQLAYGGSKRWHGRVGIGLHILTVASGVGSFVYFFCGAEAAYGAFKSIAP
ncbi:MAG: hypothetical protein H4O13_18095 [Xanthomonadales bacterium]|nr:hypothetical protein [Xanthomonadales bacterium]